MIKSHPDEYVFIDKFPLTRLVASCTECCFENIYLAWQGCLLFAKAIDWSISCIHLSDFPLAFVPYTNTFFLSNSWHDYRFGIRLQYLAPLPVLARKNCQCFDTRANTICQGTLVREKIARIQMGLLKKGPCSSENPLLNKNQNLNLPNRLDLSPNQTNYLQ